MEEVIVREYAENDLDKMIGIWNRVVRDGIAFPQVDELDEETGREFFAAQTFSAVAVNTGTGEVVGLYILHPNNIGRVGHIGNASYAVDRTVRGHHIGEQLVADSLLQAKEHGFRLMQFNAVVDANVHALHLYTRLGFQDLGTIPEGFRMKDGHYEDIHVMYRVL